MPIPDPAAATGLPLSNFIRDPFVRDAFRRAEGDGEWPPEVAAALPTPRAPKLAGGAAAAPEKECADA